MIKKQNLIFLFLLLVASSAFAQKFVYDLDFLFYFDNREYHTPYSQSQTLLGMRLSPEVGLEYVDKSGSIHNLMGGVHYMQPLCKNFKQSIFRPTLYYRYNHKKLTLYFGTIPFQKMLLPLPNILMSDTIGYLYPNIQGALLQYQSRWGFLEMQCDWRGLQSKTTREAFRIIIEGQFQYKLFYTGGFVLLNHLANKADPEPKEGVCDNFMINPMLGLNLASVTPLDSFIIQGGYRFGYDKDRMKHKSYLTHGFHVDLYLQWRFLAFQNSFNCGNNAFPLYETYGTLIYLGDPHFQSQLYNRTDFMIFFVRKSFVKCFFSWSLHYLNGYKLNHQQQIMVNFNLDKLRQGIKQK